MSWLLCDDCSPKKNELIRYTPFTIGNRRTNLARHETKFIFSIISVTYRGEAHTKRETAPTEYFAQMQKTFDIGERRMLGEAFKDTQKRGYYPCKSMC
jgi:hypothetical protein